jgi:hypothetical protein
MRDKFGHLLDTRSRVRESLDQITHHQQRPRDGDRAQADNFPLPHQHSGAALRRASLLRPIMWMRLFVILAARTAKEMSNLLCVFSHWFYCCDN